MKTIHFAVLALFVSVAGGCGDNTSNPGPPDLATPIIGHDLATSGDMAMNTACPQPSDTCVASPTNNVEILNSCPPSGTNKVDVTPFYPTMGYANCMLPTAP